MLGCTLSAAFNPSISKTGRETILPYEAQASSSGFSAATVAANSASSLWGVKSGTPASRASRLTGVGVTLKPRPAGLSGCEVTATTSCLSMRARRLGTEKSELPKKIQRILRCATLDLNFASCFGLFLGFRFGGKRLAQIGRLVRDQYAVQMIDLVLEAARQQPVGFDAHAFAVTIPTLENAAFCAGHVANDAGNRQAAFGPDPLALKIDEHRIDKRERLAFLAHVDDDDALADAYLGCSQPDTRRSVHRLNHIVDELLDERHLELERAYFLRNLAQERVRVDEDATLVRHAYKMYCERSWFLTISAKRCSTYWASTTTVPPVSGDADGTLS